MRARGASGRADVLPRAVLVVGGLAAGIGGGPCPPALASDTAPTERVHHSLRVTLEPATGHLGVSDTVSLPPGTGEVEFLLNAALRISASDPTVEEVPTGDVAPFLGINAGRPDLAGPGEVRRYRAAVPASGGRFVSSTTAVSTSASPTRERSTRAASGKRRASSLPRARTLPVTAFGTRISTTASSSSTWR